MRVRPWSIRWSILIVAAALGFAGQAGAEEARAGDAVARARELSDAGLAQFRQGDYDGALDAFGRSYEIAPEPALLFNIAQAYRKKGDCKGALDYYQRFRGAVDVQTANRARVSVHIERMQACLRGAEATLGEPLDTARPAAPPGPATEAAPASPAAPEFELPRQSPIVALSPPVVESPSGRRFRLAGITVGAAGVVTLVAAIAASLRSASIADRVSNAFDQGGPATPALDQLVSQGRAYQTASEVLYATGVAAVLTGAVLYYWGARRPGRSRATATGSGDRAAVSFTFSFF